MLLEYLDRRSLDNYGEALVSFVNIEGMTIAFWNGFSSNFGNGNCRTLGR